MGWEVSNVQMEALAKRRGRCDVCGTAASLTVSASALVLSPIARCSKCLSGGLEPYSYCISASLFLRGQQAGSADLRSRFHPSIAEHMDVTLQHLNKTWRDLADDVREAERDYFSAHRDH